MAGSTATPYHGLLTVRNIFGITQPARHSPHALVSLDVLAAALPSAPQRLACLRRRDNDQGCAPRGRCGNIKDSQISRPLNLHEARYRPRNDRSAVISYTPRLRPHTRGPTSFGGAYAAQAPDRLFALGNSGVRRRRRSREKGRTMSTAVPNGSCTQRGQDAGSGESRYDARSAAFRLTTKMIETMTTTITTHNNTTSSGERIMISEILSVARSVNECAPCFAREDRRP